MATNTTANTNVQNIKKPSHRASIAGGILSVLALMMSGLAHIMLRLEPEHTTQATTAAEKAGQAVADGTAKALFTILSMPFTIAGGLLGLLAIIFTLIRLPKVRVVGLILSVVWLALAAWAIWAAFGALEMVKAK